MGSFISWIFIVFSCLLPEYDSTSVQKCPLNCICYSDILSNLASWEWIESDVHSNPNDPEHHEFNPYTEHNEVYDNPRSVNFLRNAEAYHTVTCILRNDSPLDISETFSEIPSNTQVLSILQGAGSGNITLERVHLEPLAELVGIDIQGYKDSTSELPRRPSSFRLAADALLPLRKLTYLSLDNVLLHQRSVEPPAEEYTSRIVSLRKAGTHFNSTYEGSEVLSNLESQLIFLSPKDSKAKEPIVPYSVYKSRAVTTGTREAEPRAKPLEPKVAVAFTGIPSLLHLRISECNMQDITWDMFHQLQSLKFLLLERNDLLFLPDFAFYATSNLTTLSLSGNRILSLETVGLAGLLYLQKLDMTHNNITHLSELSLPPFPHLEIADFRHNPIEAIYPNTFEVMNSTKSLFLGNPLIALQIFPNSFLGLANLHNLEITNIRIGFLERPMFKGLLNLKSLIMDGQIKRISYDAFSETPNLEKLTLRNCKIDKISMDAFIGLSSLLELDLSHNQITFLPPAIFDDQSSLREIYLQHNQLTTLPLNLFSRTPTKMIRLEGNPWHCSCDMTSWNAGKINQVRNYYIPKNDTLCQRQYDKGSFCHFSDKLGFQVKYVYEKRVTPICETPKKFKQRSVFNVLRKELQYCSASVAAMNSTNPVKTKTKTGKGLKAMTKLLKTQGKFPTKPEKVRKLARDNFQRSTEMGDITTQNTIVSPEAEITVTTTTPAEITVTTATPVVITSELQPMLSSVALPTNMSAIEVTTTEVATTEEGSEVTTEQTNDVIRIPVPIHKPNEILPILRKPSYQLNSLKSQKWKYGTTPPPLKSITRNVLSPPNQRPVSKKSLKFSKQYGSQKRENRDRQSN